jgi:hypothetical protein
LSHPQILGAQRAKGVASHIGQDAGEFNPVLCRRVPAKPYLRAIMALITWAV